MLRIPSKADNVHRFSKLILKAANKYIPRGFRKKYVQCWNERCNELLREYKLTQSLETADQLLDALSEERR